MSQLSETWRAGRRVVRVSNLNKVFWPEDGMTKGDMLRYYQTVAPTLLRHLKDRPVTLRAFPDGIRAFSFYRRDVPQGAPTWLRRIDYRPETAERVIQLPVIDDAAGLLSMANEGNVEFHAWSSRVPDLAQPDVAIFDLDPGDRASFGEVLQAALRLRSALEGLGLRGYPKTSGGRGMHVYLPLAPGHRFDSVRTWVRSVAEDLAAAYPNLVVVAHGATHRGREVTIDHAQNSMGRNTAAAYTLRALPGAPVSAPLRWEEVEAGHVRPADLTVSVMPQRLEQLGDLFTPVLKGGQNLP